MKSMMRLTRSFANELFKPDVNQLPTGQKHESVFSTIKPPCHPSFNVTAQYVPLDGLIVLSCKLCEKPFTSLLIADSDPADRPPSSYPAWDEHQGKVIYLWEMQENKEKPAPPEDIARHKVLIRQSWLNMPEPDQKLGLAWYISNRIHHGYKMYLGHEEPK